MKNISIIDKNFGSSWFKKNQNPYFKWVTDINQSDIVVLSDFFLNNPLQTNKKQVAWLVEPPVIHPYIYNYIYTNYQKFDLVFTFEKSLLNLDKKFRLYIFGTSWLNNEEMKVYKKSKLVSVIASEKRWAPGHIFRHQCIDATRGKIDLFGRGYNPIESKLLALKDYRYSLVVLNCKIDNYFTDALIDCFLTGTIPIFWGCPNINTMFDINGILSFDNISELNNILNNISESDYNNRIISINKNFEIAKQFIYPEKWLWENGLKDL